MHILTAKRQLTGRVRYREIYRPKSSFIYNDLWDGTSYSSCEEILSICVNFHWNKLIK